MDARACLPRPPLRAYAEKTARLTSNWQSGSGPLRLEKSTISNLFRYQPRGAAARRLSLGEFNHVLALDRAARTVEVEGLTTYETVVRYCLEHGFLPLVAPELKHITVGGATVGIGIESTCYRYGFVHDGLREADVLLPGGKIVTARADNEHADLFDALPNSYGTLGYILRAKIALHRASRYVHLHVEKFRNAAKYLEAMRVATESPDLQFVEGLFFEDNRYFLMTGRFVDKVPHCDDIVRRSVFYRLVETRRDIYLKTFDYIFRYDPDWFWNVPETGFFNLFRRYAPERWRNSAFYTKYVAMKRKALGALGIRDDRTEPLIQDWEVPWRHGEELIRFAIDNVDLGGSPVGRRADQSAAPADAVSDQAERALFQSRLLLPGAAARRHGAVSLHEDPRPQVLRPRRHQDAVLVVVLGRSRVRRAVQRRGLPEAEGEVRRRR